MRDDGGLAAVLRRMVIGDHLMRRKRHTAGLPHLKTLTMQPYVPICAATYCAAPKRYPMFKFIADWIARFFAPALEIIGNLPPQALSRIVAPY
jgi:hypothetical protein